MKSKLTIKVREGCSGSWWTYGVCIGKVFHFAIVSGRKTFWEYKSAAIRNAKAMAKRTGIKYDPEILKQHGC